MTIDGNSRPSADISPPLSDQHGPLVGRLYTPVDIGMLVLFRIMFGGAMALEACRYFLYGWIDTQFVEPPLHFTYYGFSWVRPLPGIGMHCVFALLGISAACVAFGFLYRLSSVLLFVTAAWVFLTEQALYLNHFYLIVLLCGISMFLPANRAWSLDVRIRPQIHSWTAPAWTLWLLRFQIGIAYFYGGIAKLNPDWLAGVPMQMMMIRRLEMPIVGQFFESDAMVYSYAWGGMLFDLLIVPLLLWRRTQTVAYLAAVLFHMSNARMFDIGIFPLLMVMASVLFFPPEMLRAKGRPESNDSLQPPDSRERRRRQITVSLLALYVLLQLIIPFRHLLYPGDVSWTEEGHRFAWRMKLRIKQATAEFHAWDADGEKIEGIPQPSEILTARQLRLMTGRPDMILQYAHFVARHLDGEGYSDYRVTVASQASLNGREPQTLVNPDVNLAEVPRTLWPADWIEPLQTPLPTLEEVRTKERARIAED